MLELTIRLCNYKLGEIGVQLIAPSGEPLFYKVYASNQKLETSDLIRDVSIHLIRNHGFKVAPRIALMHRGSTKPLEVGEAVWAPRMSRYCSRNMISVTQFDTPKRTSTSDFCQM